MARYQRLTLMEREELSRMLAAGYSLRGHRPGAAPSPQHPVARTLPPSRLARDLSGGTGPPTGASLGAPTSEAAQAGGAAPLADGGLRPAHAALVPRTDCSRVAAAVS